ncbi:MAG TPA: hypothetical protein VNU68_21285 [Verrucomicrobiae bacterium]|nr:hypothetical protein [Verrucomicrobiae bacterium]
MKVHIIEGPARFRLVLCKKPGVPIGPKTAEILIEESNTVRAELHGGRCYYRNDRLVRRLVAMN